MKIAALQYVLWDKPLYFGLNDLDIKRGDRVIVKVDTCTELAEVVKVLDVEPAKLDKILDSETLEKYNNGEFPQIIRLASIYDTDNIPSSNTKDEALKYAKGMKEKFNLPMKIVDVHFSHDGSKVTFAFIADGRVDFRSMVKDMTRHFSKSIRLQQIGIRDEAKISGDVGGCGKNLCCRTHLHDLESITSDMAEIQQCSHRGSDRLSGVCGRLMCCLSYEFEGYKHCAGKLPEIGRKVNVDGRRGVVVGHHVLKEAVDVEFPAENGEQRARVEVDLNRNKKKK